MAIKYLYIDDETEESVEGIIKHLNTEPEKLVVEHEQPKTWNIQVKKLISDNYLNQFEGLLLDLKLEFSQGEENDVKYYGSDLAQTIRTAVKAGQIKDLPILLCSTDDKLKDFFDKTSVNLFDKKYNKDRELPLANTISEFVDFAEAYKVLNEGVLLKDILRSSENLVTDLIAVESVYNTFVTSHEKAIFLYNQIILTPGLLIDEDLLAIRLGVDKDKSTDWLPMLEKISQICKYTGVLSLAFERWWLKDLLVWWKAQFKKGIKITTARDRVEHLKAYFNINNLTPLELPNNHKYDTFWYKCVMSNYPLESADGLRTLDQPRYVWHEPSYISMAYLISEERNTKDIKAVLGANEQEIFDSLND